MNFIRNIYVLFIILMCLFFGYIMKQYFFLTNNQVAKNMEIKMFKYLAAKQGNHQCSQLFASSNLVWTDDDTIKSTLLPEMQHTWKYQDMVDLALDMLRQDPRVLHKVQ